jgi:mono/diheme cytochrome c family protein
VNASNLQMALLGAVLIAVPTVSASPAAEYDSGKREYDENCAACHGPLGKGDGVFRELLKTAVPDLTVLAKNNGGV